MTKEPDFLCADEEALLPKGNDSGFRYDRTLFPEQVSLNNTALPLRYAYAPGEERDGVTVRVPLPVAEHLSSAQLQWIVPGLREEQIGALLRALPKTIRRTLMPLEPKVREVAGTFQPGRGDFLPLLADFLTRRYGVEVKSSGLAAGQLADAPATPRGGHRPRRQNVDQRTRSRRDPGRAGKERTCVRLHGSLPRGAGKRPAVENMEFRRLTRIGSGRDRRGVRRCWLTRVCRSMGARWGCAFSAGAKRRKPPPGRACADWPERALERDLARVRKELGGLLTKVQATGTMAAKDFRSALGVFTGPARNSPGRPISDGLSESALQHVAGAALRFEPVLPLTEARLQQLIAAARRDLPLLARPCGRRNREGTRSAAANSRLREALSGSGRRRATPRVG